MWHHLRARIDNIRLRVLHHNIQEHQTVDILRGLPEGSRLSPTLFGIFVADLIRVHELQTQFPHAVINLAPGLQHNGTTQIWNGGLLYVDDLALMSTCPRELQAMLHVCQEWSVRNCMQINTQKTKIMPFFETPSLHKARGALFLARLRFCVHNCIDHDAVKKKNRGFFDAVRKEKNRGFFGWTVYQKIENDLETR